jgi:hypothetical protein
MNSADVFSLEFDMLTRTSSIARIIERFRDAQVNAATHRQLLLELNHVINVHSRLREVAADVVSPDDWSAWQDLLSVPALSFEQGRSFLDDLRALGLNSLDSVSLTPLPQTIALAASGFSSACRACCIPSGVAHAVAGMFPRRRCTRWPKARSSTRDATSRS